jgi:signal transduction histidine kinase
LAVVSHDLGNPLAAIRVDTALLLKRLSADADADGARQQVEHIRASVVHMQRLVSDLLEVQRIEAGYMRLNKQSAFVNGLLTEAIDALGNVISEKNLRVKNVLPAESAWVEVDRDRILQVFSNLLGNAVRFTAPGGEIELGAKVEARTVTFWLSDTGIGIPQEHLPHVFDRFWQAQRTGRQGIGLGLAIVKGLVEMHGGSVWVQSEVGTGTTFCFVLPRAEGPLDDGRRKGERVAAHSE